MQELVVYLLVSGLVMREEEKLLFRQASAALKVTRRGGCTWLPAKESMEVAWMLGRVLVLLLEGDAHAYVVETAMREACCVCQQGVGPWKKVVQFISMAAVRMRQVAPSLCLPVTAISVPVAICC